MPCASRSLTLCPDGASHAFIDSAWDTSIRSLLLKRYPNATPAELRQAHAYAYGGAIIQDMGYYPHGCKSFSDLTHYVRSGDFVEALLRDSQTLNEYAFAIGAMAPKELRKVLPDIPILFYSMHGSAQLIKEIRRVGVQGSVSKSDISKALPEAVNALVVQKATFFPDPWALPCRSD